MAARVRARTWENWTMVGIVRRAIQIYSRPGKPGLLPIGKTHFYEQIEPQLEKVKLGENVFGYTDPSIARVIKAGIEAAKDTKLAEAASEGASLTTQS